ncbi:hypothetical protein ATCR1_21255 [Agrobacterium tumefaciens CCNWGS0286]|uniref:hypothetical protein n=1 Tax=Agrobacterium tumefaciens TaxID=358 RepID=UPI0002334BDC|nr:hypothetical protein [Agrobacterium tumefaciens]EHH03351.1 hypothetical protein ATCR1_21255 [Agrobacterium tumefaciens CCNWGS0286]
MTYKRPAFEQVNIAHGGNTVTLRPTLRAAVTLEAAFGFPAMFRALAEGNFTIISEIIRATANSRADAAAFLSVHPEGPLSSFFAAVRMPLIELVSMLMPAPVQPLDAKAAVPTPSSAKSVTWPIFYAHQFEQATGWLGWTPEQAWNATPTEIDRAYRAHEDRLVITGVLTRRKEAAQQTDPEQAARNAEAGLDPEFDRAGLRALKAKIAGGSA